MSKSKGFVQEIKNLEQFPFDLDSEVTQPIKPPDLELTKNIVIPMYGSITIEETIAIVQLGEGGITEQKILQYVLVFLKSRSHRDWTIERVKKLQPALILKAFTAFTQEITATNSGVEVSDNGKKELTGLVSIGDSEQDIQLSQDLVSSNSDIAL